MATVNKLNTTDAFVVVDYPDTPAGGVVRVAPKVLQSSATDLCRSATYTYASFGLERSGASAGINADGDGARGAVDSFVGELVSRGDQGRLQLLAAKGVPDDADLSALNGPVSGQTLDLTLAASVLASIQWVLGTPLEGRSVAIETSKTSAPPPALSDALDRAGAQLVEVPEAADKPWLVWGAGADVIVAGSKPGTLTHQGVALLKASAVVPWGPLPVTTRALAAMQRSGIAYVPDFISAAGPLLAAIDYANPDTCGPAVTEVLDRAASDDGAEDGLFLGCAHQAERFLLRWQDRLPFGRPLAA